MILPLLTHSIYMLLSLSPISLSPSLSLFVSLTLRYSNFILMLQRHTRLHPYGMTTAYMNNSAVCALVNLTTGSSSFVPIIRLPIVCSLSPLPSVPPSLFLLRLTFLLVGGSTIYLVQSFNDITYIHPCRSVHFHCRDYSWNPGVHFISFLNPSLSPSLSCPPLFLLIFYF